MPGSMQLEKTAFKLIAAYSEETRGCDASMNHRLCVLDKNSALNFLVDTGANISVIPVNKVSKKSIKTQCNYKLYAANNSEIKTFGTIILELNLSLRRSFKWNFVIANVSQPIIGADFLSHFNLLVDLKARRLVDKITSLSVPGPIVNIISSINTFNTVSPYHDLLSQFPEITKPASFRDKPKHKVEHVIETSGPPVFAKARPLPAEKYAKVREEFRNMQEQGICRPSKSAWASPLHVVPKKNGELRPCGDYRRLNAITKPDRYPIPRLQNFTYGAAGKSIFSKLDINRAYHNICVAEQDVEKTAIITPFGLWEIPRMTFGLRNAAQTFQRYKESKASVQK